MPRYNVEYKGEWACFTSIAEGFITPFMDKEAYEQWRLSEYGKSNYKPSENCNRMTMEEAIVSIRLNRTREEAIECLREIEMPYDEIDTLLE